MILRIVAIGAILILTSIAWTVLGGTITHRTSQADLKLRGRVGQLWGTRHRQRAPWFHYIERKKRLRLTDSGRSYWQHYTVTHSLEACGSDIKVGLNLDQRRKGLLWYNTYKVSFGATYCLKNTTDKARTLAVHFPFPTRQALYDDFKVSLDGKVLESRSPGPVRKAGSLPLKAQPADVSPPASSTAAVRSWIDSNQGQVRLSIPLRPGQKVKIGVAYRSQGLDQWVYSFGRTVTQVKNFKLAMRTNFRSIDFPGGTISPTRKQEIPGGWSLTWESRNLISGFSVGMDMPKRLNPGPWAARVSFHAPVSLLLYFFMLLLITARRGVSLHPMNYFFLACAFFAFHLLMAYTVDRVSVHWAFAISAAVSLGLVVSYLRLVTGLRFALVEAGLAQLVYLVLFSTAFFFEGLVGLAVTILCIVTLFVAMQMTGRIKWSEVFSGNSVHDTEDCEERSAANYPPPGYGGR